MHTLITAGASAAGFLIVLVALGYIDRIGELAYRGRLRSRRLDPDTHPPS